jgi:sec-independent protein translocase protein TatA
MAPFNTLGFLNMPHGVEWLVILGIALLLFGKRLPDVARSIGRGVVEFKRGLKGIEDDVTRPDYQEPKRPAPPPEPSSAQPPPGPPSAP